MLVEFKNAALPMAETTSQVKAPQNHPNPGPSTKYQGEESYQATIPTMERHGPFHSRAPRRGRHEVQKACLSSSSSSSPEGLGDRPIGVGPTDTEDDWCEAI